MNFEPDQTYTLPRGGTVYVADTLLDGRLFLRDLNRSYFWRCGWDARQGWAEGFLATGGVLEPYWYEVVDGGAPVLERMWERKVRLMEEFARCGVRRRVVSVEEWLGMDDE